MHDFLLAKEILKELERIIEEKKLKGVQIVRLEIGMISLAHDDHPEHAEDINVDNLIFSLKSIAKNTQFENVEFEIKKVAGESWRITDIEIE